MNHRFFTFLLAMCAAFLVLFIIIFPEEAFQSSLQGLNIWWKIVFPSLLPFFILSEILIAYGVIRMFGVWLEPLMRFLFKVPGVGGWALAMGWTVGYPSSAQITSNIRRQNLVTRDEGEKILAISHSSSPIFIINVIAIGFFHHIQLGLFITTIHFISLLLLGIVLRLYYGDTPKKPLTQKNHLIVRSVKEMFQAHQQDGRTFGKLLGDAVISSIQNLLMIGGTMMLFAVIIKMITLTNLLHLIHSLSTHFFKNINLSENTLSSITTGWFELNLGAYQISTSQSIPFIWQVAFICSLLAWSGFSVHLQVKNLIQNTDLRYRSFLVSRMLQALLSFLLTFLFWKPYQALFSDVQPIFLNTTPNYMEAPNTIWSIWENTFTIILILLCTMFILSIFIVMFRAVFYR
ncbi:nucleoside recognition domain-containing protein [Chengkuizengella sp. SCS-71B]|uniref:nucleoside recognition domain-containing protein n=1 Tax=Chengkuizengella sp. SCS-71B TaxID=3115290 RepID=UPI0032C21438